MEKMEGWRPGVLQLAASDCEPLSLRELLTMAEEGGDDDSRQRWEELSLGYPPCSEGAPMLRREIAHGLYGGDLGPEDVLGVIPAEGILLAMHSLGLEAGDHVVAMAPGYASLSSIASQGLGCRVTHWRPEPQSVVRGAWLFPPCVQCPVVPPLLRSGGAPMRGDACWLLGGSVWSWVEGEPFGRPLRASSPASGLLRRAPGRADRAWAHAAAGGERAAQPDGLAPDSARVVRADPPLRSARCGIDHAPTRPAPPAGMAWQAAAPPAPFPPHSPSPCRPR
jgi:hypothetical protein